MNEKKKTAAKTAGKSIDFMDRARNCYEHKELERLGLNPDPEQRERILAFVAAVLRDNKKLELIPKADEENIFLRHFCDSIQSLLQLGFKKDAVVFDIGSSGGFPVFPVKIFRPDLSFVILEADAKKAAFIRETAAALNFENVEVVAGKPETVDIGRPVDYVITRMAWSLPRFFTLAKRFVGPGGHLYSYKTKQFAAELEAMAERRDRDGIRVSEIAQYNLGNVAHGLSLVSMVVM